MHKEENPKNLQGIQIGSQWMDADLYKWSQYNNVIQNALDRVNKALSPKGFWRVAVKLKVGSSHRRNLGRDPIVLLLLNMEIFLSGG